MVHGTGRGPICIARDSIFVVRRWPRAEQGLVNKARGSQVLIPGRQQEKCRAVCVEQNHVLALKDVHTTCVHLFFAVCGSAILRGPVRQSAISMVPKAVRDASQLVLPSSAASACKGARLLPERGRSKNSTALHRQFGALHSCGSAFILL